jgi:DNA-binding winged helix-turn-helix (wHTH) protein/TolB-like protein
VIGEVGITSERGSAREGGTVLGELRFDRKSGELHAPGGEVRHLSPQPTALLALLVDRAGEVVTHEELRAALWPDVTVDFDGSLHHCVRQVRAALGDQAKAPRFVETIPRRGYRLRVDAVAGAGASHAEVERDADAAPIVGDVAPSTAAAPLAVAAPLAAAAPLVAPEPIGGSAPQAHADSHAPVASRSLRRQWLPLVLALLVAALWAWRLGTPGSEAGELRVAIMAFGSASVPSREVEHIGEQVLADLANRRPDAAIVGPRTTEPLREQGLSLPQIAAALDVAYVLNARHLSGEPPGASPLLPSGASPLLPRGASPLLPGGASPLLLVELIRTSDGKHVWVRRYEQLEDWRPIATEITDGVASTIP